MPFYSNYINQFYLLYSWYRRSIVLSRSVRYDDLPLVLDVTDIQHIMGISRVSAYELVHMTGFPVFRSGRLIKVSKIAFFEWLTKRLRKATNKQEVSYPVCITAARCKGSYRGKKWKIIPKSYTKTAYMRTADRNGERRRLWQRWVTNGGRNDLSS